MKALVIYDSAFGNTEQIAKAIAGGIGAADVKTLRINQVSATDLNGIDLLVVGSPTQGGRPTQAVQDFLKAIPPASLKGVRTAAFDTRITQGGIGTFAKIFGYAAGRIESELKRCGGQHLASAGFSVKGREGPLQDGESEKAAKWSAGLVSQKAA